MVIVNVEIADEYLNAFRYLKDKYRSRNNTDVVRNSLEIAEEHEKGENCIVLDNMKEHQYFLNFIREELCIDNDIELLHKMIMLTYDLVKEDVDRMARARHQATTKPHSDNGKEPDLLEMKQNDLDAAEDLDDDERDKLRNEIMAMNSVSEPTDEERAKLREDLAGVLG